MLAVLGRTVTVQDGVTGHALARTLLERLALEPGEAGSNADALDIDALAAALLERRLPAGPILVINPDESDLGVRLQDHLRRRVVAVAANSAEAAGFFEP